MSVIINDFSLSGQFNNEEEFFDSLVEETLPMLNVLDFLNFDILSGYETYSIMVTKQKSLINLLNYSGIPEISRLKTLLSAPFWNENLFSDNGSIYKCEYTDKQNDYCLSEAYERNFPVISFKHPKFRNDLILFKKDGKDVSVFNSYTKFILLTILKKYKIIKPEYYLAEKYDNKNIFGLSIGKNYFHELVEASNLNEDDINIVINDLEKLIDFTIKGENPGRLSKTEGSKIKEFRTTLENKREIRIFYFEVNRKLTFLNGYLKKTKKTPLEELDKAAKIMKMLS